MTDKNVRDALDRMCSPLCESRLSGVTAQEDARCMALIRDEIDRLTRQLAESQARELATRKALKKHHDWAGSKGRDMSHSLSKLIVSAYEQSELCSATINALSEDSRWPALDALLKAERAKEREKCMEIVTFEMGTSGWAKAINAAIRALDDE